MVLSRSARLALAAGANVVGMTAFSNRLYAVDASSRVFFMNLDTFTWTQANITAGTGFGSPQSEVNRSWASGWGVRLLDRLVADNYER